MYLKARLFRVLDRVLVHYQAEHVRTRDQGFDRGFFLIREAAEVQVRRFRAPVWCSGAPGLAWCWGLDDYRRGLVRGVFGNLGIIDGADLGDLFLAEALVQVEFHIVRVAGGKAVWCQCKPQANEQWNSSHQYQ